MFDPTMKEEEKNIIKEKIKKEITVLERSVATLTELMDGEVQSDANDWFTTKESNPSKEVNEIALEKALLKIPVLRKVLESVDSPDYGICVICKKPIPFERMKAVPATKRCISCG